MNNKNKIKIYEVDTEVVSNNYINNDYKHLILRAPSKALDIVPGQFFHLQCPPSDGSISFLRRPMSVYQFNKKENQIESYIGKVDYENDLGSGLIDHIAFNCTGLEKMLLKLDGLNIEYTERRVDTQSRYQVFFFDPNGVKIELDFQADEAGNRMTPDA